MIALVGQTDARRAVFAPETHIAFDRGVFRAGLTFDFEVVFGLYRVVNRRHELGIELIAPCGKR